MSRQLVGPGILLVALALFISEVLRPDVVALLVLVATVVLGLVTVEQAFSGFASPAVVTVWAVFIVSGDYSRQVWRILSADPCCQSPVPVTRDCWR